MVLWIEVGGSMIAIDTLVHNFLHRTGILASVQREPPVWRGLLPARRLRRHYCSRSRADRCPAVQSNFPQTFPRFVQYAIWQYCTQNGLDVCNGNRIDDGRRCDNMDCRVRLMCDRVALRKAVES